MENNDIIANNGNDKETMEGEISLDAETHGHKESDCDNFTSKQLELEGESSSSAVVCEESPLEEDNLHGVEPITDNHGSEKAQVAEDGVEELTKKEQKIEVGALENHIEKPNSEMAGGLTPSARSTRINPFNESLGNEESQLWKYQERSLDELEKFSESYSTQSSVSNSPERLSKKKSDTLLSDICVQQDPTTVSHQAEFELIPEDLRHQKPVDDFSCSLENIELAIKAVTVQSPAREQAVVDDPWVKLQDEEPKSDFYNSNHYEESTQTAVHEKPVMENCDLNNIDEQETYTQPVYNVPGPCDAQDLIEGIIFTANYLGSTQLQSERNPGKNARMLQAQEAVSRIKAPDDESQPSVEVDLFISTDKVKMLNAETQEPMMDHTLRSISYIADIGKLLVIMARRKIPKQDADEVLMREPKQQKQYRIVCHVFSSEDAHLMAQAIGQAFTVAYQQFLTSNGIEPQTFTRDDYNELMDMQEMYHDDLVHYSKQENVKDVWVEKRKGEAMGIVIVESGWGSIVPTVILANMQHGSPVERCGKLSIGDQLMTVNGTSLVGLPLSTSQSIIKGLKSQSLAHLHIVSCPPVVTVIIKRPDLKYQLGFSVQDGIICSLMRGGIAERGGVRVGHRIIEINGQSVVATPHDKIVQQLVTSLGEIQMKTMPATMYRLLTGQEQPVYI